MAYHDDDTIWHPEVPEREIVHDYPLGDDRGYELVAGHAHRMSYHEGLLVDEDLDEWHAELRAQRERRRTPGFAAWDEP